MTGDVILGAGLVADALRLWSMTGDVILGAGSHNLLFVFCDVSSLREDVALPLVSIAGDVKLGGDLGKSLLVVVFFLRLLF
jgi:hypothetical protein